MKALRLEKDGGVLVPAVDVAARLHERMRGLLGRRTLAPGRALLITPCSGIHTFCMRFALDVLFLDRDLVVVKTAAGIRPWRCVPGGRAVNAVLEMQAGWFRLDDARPGDRLALRVSEESGEHQ